MSKVKEQVSAETAVTQEGTKVFGEVQTRKTEKVIIGKRVYKGKSYAEARTWYIPTETSATWFPTKKGFIIPMSELPKVITALCDMSEAEGLNANKV